MFLTKVSATHFQTTLCDIVFDFIETEQGRWYWKAHEVQTGIGRSTVNFDTRKDAMDDLTEYVENL